MNSTDAKNMSIRRAIAIGVTIGVVLGITFVAGYILRDFVQGSLTASATATDGYPLVDDVQMLLDDVYLREQPTYTQRQYAAIRGLLSSLDDPNTFFIEPSVARSEADALAGTYGGIGVQLQRNEAGNFVLYPFPGSPAVEAGIADGAVLVAINGEAVNLDSQQDSVDQQMRGEVKADNGVELTVQQGTNDDEATFFVPFDVINIPSVVFRVLEQDARIGYVQLLRFTNRTPQELRDALTELSNAETVALILDLRGNSGGLLQESITVAGEFLDGGVVVYEDSQNNQRTLEAESGGLAIQQPLVVLVDGGTASAAELVAGAIRDRERGILIGQRTFGKGTVQQIFNLSDGSSVHITSAEWFTPDRVPLAGIGLEPNIEMIPDANGRNVELGEAIRYLQQQLNDTQNGDT